MIIGAQILRGKHPWRFAMNSTTIQLDESGTRAGTSAFLRGFVKGAAGLLDIFRSGVGQQARGTPEDDARELRGDVEAIAQDFHAVLSSIESGSKK